MWQRDSKHEIVCLNFQNKNNNLLSAQMIEKKSNDLFSRITSLLYKIVEVVVSGSCTF